jgi:hypothetical protein
MYSCPPRVNETIPGEYRPAAEALFPPDGSPRQEGSRNEAALNFARLLGIGTEYERLLAAPRDSREMRCFLVHFQNNLDLLIQKTWVEKADEKSKEKLQDRVPLLTGEIEKGNYRGALGDFSSILEELAYLFFGSQSREEDFTEYTFRIDAQMGLFWWYGARIGGCLGDPGEDFLRALLLIGLCYLTNF